MKVFIIDDDYISVFLTQNMLIKEGVTDEIISFSSAKEALPVLLSKIKEEVPSIIFLDLNMPDMNGWEFLEELRAHKEQLIARCRIYILTSSLDTADIDKASNIELVSGFIHKPIDQEDIKVILQEGDI